MVKTTGINQVLQEECRVWRERWWQLPRAPAAAVENESGVWRGWLEVGWSHGRYCLAGLVTYMWAPEPAQPRCPWGDRAQGWELSFNCPGVRHGPRSVDWPQLHCEMPFITVIMERDDSMGREGPFHPQGHWYWSGFWLWVSLAIEHAIIYLRQQFLEPESRLRWHLPGKKWVRDAGGLLSPCLCVLVRCCAPSSEWGRTMPSPVCLKPLLPQSRLCCIWFYPAARKHSWQNKKSLRRWRAEMRAAPWESRCSALQGGRAGSADGSPSSPSHPAGTFHRFPSWQLSCQHNSTVCPVVSASATGTPEMLREVTGHSSPLIQTL